MEVWSIVDCKTLLLLRQLLRFHGRSRISLTVVRKPHLCPIATTPFTITRLGACLECGSKTLLQRTLSHPMLPHSLSSACSVGL